MISITKKSRSTAGFRQGLCFGPLLLSIMSPVIQFSSITLSVAGPLLAWDWLLSPTKGLCASLFSWHDRHPCLHRRREREWKTLTLTIPRKNHEFHFFYWLRSHSFSWANHYGHWLVCSSTGTSVVTSFRTTRILNRKWSFRGRKRRRYRHQRCNYQLSIVSIYIYLFYFVSLVYKL